MAIHNLGINSILNVIRSSMSVIFPLITFPYALRVLGAVNMGKVSYSLSIISYFSLLAKYGVSMYAVREGAKIRDNKNMFTEFSNNIFSINLYFTILAYILLTIALIFTPELENYKIIILIQSVSLISGTIGIEWINTIYEDYLSVTLRSLLSYLIIIPSLFVFVKDSSDVVIYSIISMVSSSVVSIINWFYCKKYVKLRFILFPNFRPHIKQLTIFFLNSVMITIYVNIDVTMLGLINGDYSVGIYTTATKIYEIIKSLLVSVYVVMIPRLSYFSSKRDYSSYNNLFSTVVGYALLLFIPASIGLICVSDGVIYILGGFQYTDSILPLQILSIALVFAEFGGLITLCLNVTLGSERNNLVGSILGACSNFLLNFYFIPAYSYNGAAITTLISELLVFLYCFKAINNKNKYINFRIIKTNFLQGMVGSALIIISTLIIRLITQNIIYRTFAIVIVGALIYCAFLIIIKNELVINFLNKTIYKLKNR